MATTTILITASPPVVTRVTITLVTTDPGLFDGSGGAIGSFVETRDTAGDGTLAVDLEQTADITTDGTHVAATTYTIQVGSSRWAGLTVPGGGPLTLASLIPASTNRTVAITTQVDNIGEAGLAGLLTSAYLSKDCWNLDGKLIKAFVPYPVTTDSTGLVIWYVDRTDHLTPVDGSPVEPYLTFNVGSSTFVKKVHAAGPLEGLTTAISTTFDGSFAGTAEDLAPVAGYVPVTGAPVIPPEDLADSIVDLAWEVQHSRLNAMLLLDFDFGTGSDVANGLSCPANLWTDVGINHSFTVPVGTTVLAFLVFGNAIINQNADARILIDSATTAIGKNYHAASATGVMNMLAGVVSTNDPLAIGPGTHTVKIQVNPAVDASLWCRTSDPSQRERYFLQIIAYTTTSGGGGGGAGSDTTAVHLNPASPEAGSSNITGAGSFGTSVITPLVQGLVIQAERITSQGASPVTCAVNDSGAAGAGATLDPGTGAQTLYGKVTLLTGTTPAAGRMGDVVFIAPLDDPTTLNGRFYGKDAVSVGLEPYAVDKSDGSGIELWVRVVPDPSTTYLFGYNCYGA